MSIFTTAIERYLEKHGFEAWHPKAVLFDMDGVLYDSMKNHVVAWRESMAHFGIHMTEYDAYATEGQRGVDTIAQLAKAQTGRDITPEQAQTMYDLKSQTFHALPETPIMEGIPSLMKKIHASGLQIGVVTGSGQRPLIRRLLTDFGTYLDEQHIVTAYDISKGKPAPDPYLMGLKKMGDLQPWEAVVVENAPLGVKAGAAARIMTIAVNTGILPDQMLADAGADLIFPKMTALSDAWHDIVPIQRRSQDQRWSENYDRIMAFMLKNKRRPSKYRPEEREMLNWIKYVKKRIAKGTLSAERQQKFQQLTAAAQHFRRINQYT